MLLKEYQEEDSNNKLTIPLNGIGLDANFFREGRLSLVFVTF